MPYNRHSPEARLKKKEYDRLYIVRNRDRKNKYKREWRNRNSERLRANQRAFYAKHKEKIREYRMRYNVSHPEVRKKSYQKNHKKWYKTHLIWMKANPDKIRGYVRKLLKKKYRTNIQFRIAHNLRTRMRRVIRRGGGIKSERTNILIGCSPKELILYLESKFQSGMTWGNYGRNGGWHIDHIKPCILFDLSDGNQQLRCFNYRNLQPLWEIDNLRKKDRYEDA